MKKQDDNFDQLIRSTFKVESTSDNFTNELMSKINSTPQIDPALQTPLVSKKVWLAIAIFYTICFIGLWLTNSSTPFNALQFLSSLPFDKEIIFYIEESFILSFQIIFVVCIVYLGDYTLKKQHFYSNTTM